MRSQPFKILLAAALLGVAATTLPGAAHAAGAIAGTITDLRDGSPVAGTTLRLGRRAFFGGFDPEPSVPAAISGSDGEFVMPSVPAGVWALSIEPPAPFLRKFWPDMPCRPTGSCGPEFSSELTVVDDTVFRADAWVSPEGAISGRVTREPGGGPVSGAQVTARWIGLGNVVVTTSTDAQGDYSILALPVGAYQIDADGGPALMAEVYDDVHCVPSCFAVHVAAQRTPVQVAPQQVRPNVDFALAEGAVIAGTVREAPGRVPTLPVGVSIKRLIGDAFENYGGHAADPATGAYVFSGLPAGTYVVSTYRYSGSLTHVHQVYDGLDCAADACSEAEKDSGTHVVLGPQQRRADVDFEIEPAASMSGCVRSAVDGSALPDVRVVVYRTPLFWWEPSDVTHATTGDDGCYTAGYLPQSFQNYRLRTVNGGGFVDQLHPHVNCLGGSCPLDSGGAYPLAHDQDLAGLEFSLEVGASLGGRVIAYPGGPGIGGARLLIHDAAGNQVRELDAGALLTGADGRFQTYGLVDGTYYLSLVIPDGIHQGIYRLGAATPPGAPAPPATAGTPLVITGGTSLLDLEFALMFIGIFDDGFE